MAEVQKDLVEKLQLEMAGVASVSQQMASELHKAKDEIVNQKIDIIKTGFSQMLTTQSSEQMTQNKDMQIQMTKFHVNLLNQQRVTEQNRFTEQSRQDWYHHNRYENGGRKRARDYDDHFNRRNSNGPEAGGSGDPDPEPWWSMEGCSDHTRPPTVNERARPSTAARDWKTWSPVDIQNWMVAIGCPLFAATCFPPANSPRRPPVALANGEMLVSFHKYIDQIPVPTDLEYAFSFDFERGHLKIKLGSLILTNAPT